MPPNIIKIIIFYYLFNVGLMEIGGLGLFPNPNIKDSVFILIILKLKKYIKN
jgi:hypothetical protein